MNVGVLRMTIHMAGSRSLKDKRAIVRSLLARVGAQFNVATAEVGELDRWQVAELAVACVSNSSQHADEVLARVVNFVTSWPGESVVTDVETEILHLG